MEDDLKRMLEAMAEGGAARAAADESYRQQMDDLHRRHPNQWVLCREHWNDQMSEVRLEILGPFATQDEAVGQWDELAPDQRAGYTVEFLESPLQACYKLSSPVVSFAPPRSAPGYT